MERPFFHAALSAYELWVRGNDDLTVQNNPTPFTRVELFANWLFSAFLSSCTGVICQCKKIKSTCKFEWVLHLTSTSSWAAKHVLQCMQNPSRCTLCSVLVENKIPLVVLKHTFHAREKPNGCKLTKAAISPCLVSFRKANQSPESSKKKKTVVFTTKGRGEIPCAFPQETNSCLPSRPSTYVSWDQ